MTKRIFRSICFAALIVFFATVILIMGVLYEYFSDTTQAQHGLIPPGMSFTTANPIPWKWKTT